MNWKKSYQDIYNPGDIFVCCRVIGVYWALSCDVCLIFPVVSASIGAVLSRSPLPGRLCRADTRYQDTKTWDSEPIRGKVSRLDKTQYLEHVTHEAASLEPHYSQERRRLHLVLWLFVTMAGSPLYPSHPSHQWDQETLGWIMQTYYPIPALSVKNSVWEIYLNLCTFMSFSSWGKYDIFICYSSSHY